MRLTAFVSQLLLNRIRKQNLKLLWKNKINGAEIEHRVHTSVVSAIKLNKNTENWSNNQIEYAFALGA